MPMAGHVSVQPTAAARLGGSLGWFSLAAGAASLLMPGPVARSAGLFTNQRTLRAMRAMGLRELASGAGILLRPQRPGWLWMRVAGDAMDLALLGLSGRRNAVDAEARHVNSRQRLMFASAALAGVMVLDMLAAYEQGRLKQLGLRYGPQRDELDATGALRIKKSIAINQSPETCYRFWRNVENFPRFMHHVEEVHTLDATRSHWTLRSPPGRPMEWTAELASDVPSQQLGWRTLPGAEVDHAGVVRFMPASGGRATTVEVDLSYRAPPGKPGGRIASLLGEVPAQQIDDDLRRFKQLIETGEIPTTVGQSAGQRSLVGRLLHPGKAG
ncbi:MAG: hypothetical protein RL404_1746 [Pseudomonadota bacterium]